MGDVTVERIEGLCQDIRETISAAERAQASVTSLRGEVTGDGTGFLAMTKHQLLAAANYLNNALGQAQSALLAVAPTYAQRARIAALAVLRDFPREDRIGTRFGAMWEAATAVEDGCADVRAFIDPAFDTGFLPFSDGTFVVIADETEMRAGAPPVTLGEGRYENPDGSGRVVSFVDGAWQCLVTDKAGYTWVVDAQKGEVG